MQTPPPPFAPPTAVVGDASEVGHAEDSSPGVEQRIAAAPWRRGREGPADQVAEDRPVRKASVDKPVAEDSREDKPVWKAEDFPALNPHTQDGLPGDFPPLRQAMTPRRSCSRRRSRCDSISEEMPQITPRGGMTPKKSRGYGGSCIPEDRLHRGPTTSSFRSISEDKPHLQQGLPQKSCPPFQHQRQFRPQPQQPQVHSAWQQRMPREAKSVEPEQRPREAKSVEPERRGTLPEQPRSRTLSEGQLKTPQELGGSHKKEPSAEGAPTVRQTSENRCQSEPVQPASSHESFEAAGAEAAKIAQVHRDLRLKVQSMSKLADEVKAAGRLDPALLQTFVGDYGKMVQLMQDLQGQGAAAQDAPALAALNLLLVANQPSSSRGSIPGMATVAEHALKPKPVGLQSFQDGLRSGLLPTPARSGSFVPVFMPQMQGIPGGLVPAAVPNMWVPQGVLHGPSINEYRAPSLQPRPKPRLPRKYNVINPATGERMVIRSVVPFKMAISRRLPIVDPRTGAEVFPDQPARLSQSAVELRSGGQAQDEMRTRASVASSRLSNGTTCSGPRRSVTPSAGRRERKSIAGRAIHDGRTWTLEPASGGHWDWPLSRQEKKERVLMLQQLELLAEIDDLQAAACGEHDFE